jgi:hypothetical protein
MVAHFDLMAPISSIFVSSSSLDLKPSMKRVSIAITVHDVPRKQKHEMDEILQRLEGEMPPKPPRLTSTTSPSTNPSFCMMKRG